MARLTPVAYADTPAQVWPLAARSLQSHALKLVADGRLAWRGADPADGEPALALL